MKKAEAEKALAKFTQGGLNPRFIPESELVELHEYLANIGRFWGPRGESLDLAIAGAFRRFIVMIESERREAYERRKNIRLVANH